MLFEIPIQWSIDCSWLMPVPLTLLPVFCGVIGFTCPSPQKAGASALQGLSLIAAGGGERNEGFPASKGID
jgi:hypothetical protein